MLRLDKDKLAYYMCKMYIILYVHIMTDMHGIIHRFIMYDRGALYMILFVIDTGNQLLHVVYS